MSCSRCHPLKPMQDRLVHHTWASARLSIRPAGSARYTIIFMAPKAIKEMSRSLSMCHVG